MDLYGALCSYDNLFLAYKKARKRKTTKPYIIEFEKNLKENLLLLRSELLLLFAQTREGGDGLHPTDKSVGIRPTIL